MKTEQRLTQISVELADTLVDEFDALDFLHTLTERSVELLNVDAAGVILSDLHGHLQVVASTSSDARALELFELHSDEGPCLDCFTTGRAVTNVEAAEATRRWRRSSAAFTRAGYQSAHAVPLRLRSQVIGAMNLFCTGPDDPARRGPRPGSGADRRRHHRPPPGTRDPRVGVDRRTAADGDEQPHPHRAGQGGPARPGECQRRRGVRLLRGHSRRHQVPLRDVAAQVIDGTITPGDLVVA